MTCDALGPDLLALALGQLAPAEAAEVEAHLAACGPCRAELDGIRRAIGATAAARAQDDAGTAPRALRRRILAAIADDAADRRAEAAVASARSCPDVREDLPRLVLGDLDTVDRARVASHLAGCAPCSGERDAIERLVTAQRAAARASAEASPALRSRVLASIQGSRMEDAPPPPSALRVVESRKARTRARRLALLVPLVAAACMVAAITLTAPSVGLHVADDSGALYFPFGQPLNVVPAYRIDRGAGEVSLSPGSGVGAGSHAVDVRLRLGGRRAAPASSAPAPGEVRLRLQPGTQLFRESDEVYELRCGRVSVRAGRLDARLTLRHGRAFAAIVGTRFDAEVVGGRLVVSVAEGAVEVGSEDGPSRRIGPGEDALADGVRLLTRRADGTPAADAFLAPRASLDVRNGAALRRGGDLLLGAELSAGDAGPVRLAGLDDSDPRLLVRLKGPDGRDVEVKVQRSMLSEPPAAELPGEPGRGGAAARPTVQVAPGRPYRLALRLSGLALAPGRWEARLRYQSYAEHDPGDASGTDRSGAEWHGTVESGPAAFEVIPE